MKKRIIILSFLLCFFLFFGLNASQTIVSSTSVEFHSYHDGCQHSSAVFLQKLGAALTCNSCGQVIQGRYYRFFIYDEVYCNYCFTNYNHCTHCGVPIGTKGVMLTDGQFICPRCYKSSVLSETTALSIFAEVRNEMQYQLGLVVNHNVGIIMVDKKQLEQMGKSLGKGNDAVNLRGFYYRVVTGTKIYESNIFLLYGVPWEKMVGTVAHEYTHAWQTENCPRGQNIVLVEGFAQWVAYKILISKGYQREAKHLTNMPDPVYGNGLRYMLELEKSYGVSGVINYVKTTK